MSKLFEGVKLSPAYPEYAFINDAVMRGFLLSLKESINSYSEDDKGAISFDFSASKITKDNLSKMLKAVLNLVKEDISYSFLFLVMLQSVTGRRLEKSVKVALANAFFVDVSNIIDLALDIDLLPLEQKVALATVYESLKEILTDWQSTSAQQLYVGAEGLPAADTTKLAGAGETSPFFPVTPPPAMPTGLAASYLSTPGGAPVGAVTPPRASSALTPGYLGGIGVTPPPADTPEPSRTPVQPPALNRAGLNRRAGARRGLDFSREDGPSKRCRT